MDYNNNNKIHILLGVSGSVAAHKVPNVISHLRSLFKESQFNCKICVVATKSSLHFLKDYLISGPKSSSKVIEEINRFTPQNPIKALGSTFFLKDENLCISNIFNDVDHISELCELSSDSLLYIPESAKYVSNTDSNTHYIQKWMTNVANILDLTKDNHELILENLGSTLTPVLIDDDEWRNYKYVKQDPVIHIKLRDWADYFVMCPLSANTLAKISNGLCDNLLTSIIRAWDLNNISISSLNSSQLSFLNDSLMDVLGFVNEDNKNEDNRIIETLNKMISSRIILVPAMNPSMYLHYVTDKQLNQLSNKPFNFLIIPPIKKILACGDIGIGALPSPENISSILYNIAIMLGKKKK